MALFGAFDANLSVFATFNGSLVLSSGSQRQADVIQSGRAFFIQNDASNHEPSITFTEASNP